MPNKAIAELSADAAVLIAKISQRDKGEMITYDEIKNMIGWDIRDNRGIMCTVRNRLLRDHNKVIDPVRGIGYRILTDPETASGRLRSDRESRRRSATRSKLKAGSVDLSALNDTQRLGYLAEVTAAHITIEASGEKSLKQIESKLNGSTTPLALTMALDAIKPNLK